MRNLFISVETALKTGLLALTLVAHSAYSQNVTAYMIANPTEGQLETVVESARSQGLSNCKQLVQEVFEAVVVVQVRCTSVDDLNAAVADGLLSTSDVGHKTIWVDRRDGE